MAGSAATATALRAAVVQASDDATLADLLLDPTLADALTTQQPAGAFGASSEPPPSSAAGAQVERKLHLRVGREGMVDLLSKLDKVQAQIDKLS